MVYAFAAFILALWLDDHARAGSNEFWQTLRTTFSESLRVKVARSLGHDSEVLVALEQLRDRDAPLLVYAATDSPSLRDLERLYRLRGEVACLLFPQRVTWGVGARAIPQRPAGAERSRFYVLELITHGTNEGSTANLETIASDGSLRLFYARGDAR